MGRVKRVPSVLYVEDEVLLALSVADALEREGMRVSLAHDGHDGVAQALQFAPDIIVSDYMMPRMDGLAMLRMLRASGIGAPAILTTAVPQGDLGPEVMQQVQEYLAKPFDERKLAETIRQLLERSGESRH